MADDEKEIVDPFQRPTPYEILGMTNSAGLKSSGREIGRAHGKAKRAARRIKDTSEKAKRNEEIDQARDLLIRPDDRVLVDFFLLGENVVGDICLSVGRRLEKTPLPTKEVMGSLYPKKRYDDLVPDNLQRFETPLKELSIPEVQESLGAHERIPLISVEL